jgi:CRISPR-associated protein Cmr6
MIAPLFFQEHQMPPNPGTGHRGLWFDRFFDRYDPAWSVIENGKKGWIDTVTGLCGDGDQLKYACQAHDDLCCTLAGRVLVLRTTWHFATGLGNPHPVENGFAWHPTLGVPYLTGAAVKGLIRAWVEDWREFDGENEDERRNNRLATLYRWFGSEAKDPKERARFRQEGFEPPTKGEKPDTEAGMFIFFDAIPIAPVKLTCDVMTPHYGGWYEQGGEIQDAAREANKIPADWHNPVPVPFLVVRDASFLFCIAPRRNPNTEERKIEVKAELDKIMQALTDALQHLGAGAKTAAGYGRLEEDEVEKARRERAAKQLRLQDLDPEERMREEISQLGEEQLARMFGRDFNKTREAKASIWDAFVRTVLGIHGRKIRAWESSANRNMKKAFKKLYGKL